MSYQRVIIQGNAGRDPETKYLANGDPVCSLSVATSERWKDKTTGEKREETEWWRVIFFGPQAEVAGEYIRKGMRVLIEGRMKTRKYTDRDGHERSITELKSDKLVLLEKAPDAPPKREPTEAKPAQRPPQDDFEDDIPF